MKRILRGVLLGVLGAAAAGAASEAAGARLELDGRVTGTRIRLLQVTLFSVGQPFTATTFTNPVGEFEFHSLPSGTYTVSVMRRTLGEVRRTVVVTASLADRKRRVRVTIPYSAAEAAANGSAGKVSRQQLSVPKGALRKYGDAQKHLAKRDAAGATRDLEQAVEAAPQFAAAWNGLGVIAYQTGDLSRAEEKFRKALEADPQAFEPAVNLGGVLLAEGRIDEALPFNRKAADERPKDSLANAQLGMSYYKLGDFDRAEPALAAARRADPSNFSRPQLFLARIYLQRGNVTAALRELRDCVARYPDASDAESLRGEIRELEAR